MQIETSTNGERLTVTVTFHDGQFVEWSEDIGICRLAYKESSEDELEQERKAICWAINMAISNALASREFM